MRKLAELCFTILFLSAILAGIAFVAGITPDGLLHEHRADTDDHPTNWLDTALHP